MTELACTFLSHVLARAEELCREMTGSTVTSDGEHVTIVTPSQVAHVNFYELDPGMPEVVELNSASADDPDNPTFFLYFEMDELAHAQELLEELMGTLSQGTKGAATKVLLSCTSGLTTSLFARKLAEVGKRSRSTTSSRRCPSTRPSRSPATTLPLCSTRRST